MASLRRKLSSQSLAAGVTIFLAIFLCSGGIMLAISFFAPVEPSYVRWVVSTPFYAGFVWLGVDGLLLAVKNKGSSRCLEGFVIAGVSYVCIEVLFWFCGGSKL